jgi:very-short-patch-repair endonuclease
MKPRIPAPLTRFAQKLRREQTREEALLWKHLRMGQLDGHHFRRQHPVPPYVADFANLKAQLMIELDGGQHDTARDKTRDTYLEAQGWRVLRFCNEQMHKDLDYVLLRIKAALANAPT